MFSRTMIPLGYQQITPAGTAVALTVPVGANMALFTAEAAAIRFLDDATGALPTTSAGFLLPVGILPFEYSGTLKNVRIINAASGGILNVLYYQMPGG